MIDQAFYKILSNNSSITNVIGGEIYAIVAPYQSDLYCTYQEIYHDRPKNIDNSSGQHSAAFQLDIYGISLISVSSFAQVVVDALDGVSNSDYGHTIQVMRIDAERGGFEPETKLYRKSLDFSLFFD